MKKIKILHKIGYSIGGIENYIFNNMEYIDKNRFQFDFLTRNTSLNTTGIYIKYKFGIKNFSTTDRCSREIFVKEINDILDEGYDVVHLHTPQWTGLLLEELAMKKNIPKVIVHAHSTGLVVPVLDVDKTSDTLEKYKKVHEQNKLKIDERYATDFCACSNEAADWLFGPQISRDKIHIMKNAINVDKYIYNEQIRKNIRLELGIDDCFVLGHVGRMSYEKNQEFLIDVFAKIHQKYKKVKLLLVGSGNMEESLKRRVSQYDISDSVLFLGWRDDINNIMQAMDLFLMPSKFEGLGIALIEAQASGLRCICSDKVPKEAAITKNVAFMELDHEKWIDCICKNLNKYERQNKYEIVTNAGYNIKYAVKELEKLYES